MKKRKPLTKAQKEAQERNWLKFRIYGMDAVLYGKNIKILKTMIPENCHFLIANLIFDLQRLTRELKRN